MLKKRVIFALIHADGQFMLSRNFRLQRVGDLIWLQKNYNFSKVAHAIDELIILDASRGEKDIDSFCEIIKSVVDGCFVPIAAGGGIRSVTHAKKLLRSGADKVVVNSVLSSDPQVVKDISRDFGRQCVVAAVDIKQEAARYTVMINNGSLAVDAEIGAWIEQAVSCGAGEIYLNSIDRDGTGQGYLFNLLDMLPPRLPIPVILAGGAGHFAHLAEGLRYVEVDAVATAHLFNFVGTGLETARTRLLEDGFALPQWDTSMMKNLARETDID